MKLIRLLLGSIFFIVLCGSGMMLLVLFLGFSEGHLNARSLVLLLISVSVFFASSISLYYLSRETPEVEPSETSKKFKSRKLKLQLLVIALITVFILAIPFIAGTTNYVRAAGAIIAAIFFGLYIQLAKRLWRCPACEAQLPFMNEYKDRQSIKSCPSCNAQLQ
ncbi:hypothetical protein [Atopomonas hussainii]|uniref:hypothetical protein n=1 Tax=Atopomonas hussainii TaxID=1429083 RepID=UPI001114EA91|nr:hypothetical protein [Atopomonas hussainii]